jgi:hypothetical protein
MIELIEPKSVSPIASRWKEGHVIRQDRETGTYEEINSPIYSRAEVHVQAALFRPAPSNLDRLWNQKREHQPSE